MSTNNKEYYSLYREEILAKYHEAREAKNPHVVNVDGVFDFYLP